MSSRDEVLARVRSALGTDRDHVDVPREYNGPGGAGDIDVLVDRLIDYKAEVHRCTAQSVPETIATAVSERGARSLVRPVGLPEEWTQQLSVDVIVDDGQLTSGDLDVIDGVITGCALAVAETGTVVLDGSPDQGRRIITLVPDYHLCVVLADQVFASVPDALERLEAGRPLTWISGPSATSDIELSRVEGVHGPRTLVVVIVDPSPAGLPEV